MTYVALLYSPSLDQFETDCESCLYTSYMLAEWLGDLPSHYNKVYCADDFYIVSITKMGE